MEMEWKYYEIKNELYVDDEYLFHFSWELFLALFVA